MAYAFDLGYGITLDNSPHAIGDVDKEVVDREAALAQPQRLGQAQATLQPQANQVCVYQRDDPRPRPLTRSPVYILDYRAPGKLTSPHLRCGLRPMNVYGLTAAALTHTYRYMIESGLEYSLLTTVGAIVFLRITWEDAGTLYYHLAEP